jgi:hypothetical protein
VDTGATSTGARRLCGLLAQASWCWAETPAGATGFGVTTGSAKHEKYAFLQAGTLPRHSQAMRFSGI